MFNRFLSYHLLDHKTCARVCSDTSVIHTVQQWVARSGKSLVLRDLERARMERARIERIGEARGSNGERRLLVSGEALVPGAQLITTHLPNALTGLKVDVADFGASAQ